MPPLDHSSPEWTKMIEDVATLKADFASSEKTRDMQHAENRTTLTELKTDMADTKKDVAEIKAALNQGKGGLSASTKLLAVVGFVLMFLVALAGLIVQVLHR